MSKYVSKDGIIVVSQWSDLGITVSGMGGQKKVACPECQSSRKKNASDKPLSINIGEGTGNCHNCGQKFLIDKGGFIANSSKREYKTPEQSVYTEVTPEVANYFLSKRHISAKTLRHAQLTEGMVYMPQQGKEVSAVHFNYYDGNDIVNIKYRDGFKNFKLYGGAKLIFYNINVMYTDIETLVITEGEIDTLSYIEAGVSHVISVPNGASKGNTNMEYLNHHYNLFDDDYRTSNGMKPINKIILAMDDDEAGKSLRDEFVRRLGADRCYFVDFKGHNDPNEMLVKEGKVALFNTVDLSTPAPISDIMLVKDLSVELAKLQKEGLQPGAQVGCPEFQALYSFEQPRLTVVTGISTHGKSEYVDDMVSRLAVWKNWKFGIFSPENFPIEYHISKLVSKIVGKHFNDCTGMELQEAYNFIAEHFFWIYPENDDYTLTNLFRINDILIRRYGVNGMIIDPWTEVDKGGKTNTEDINDHLSLMNRYKRDRNVHIFLVAHPKKMPKDPTTNKVEVPELMDISGSANFFNKADGGMTVYRDFDTEEVSIIVNKVKFKHLGKLGKVVMQYNLKSGRYEETNRITNEGWDDSNWLHQEEQANMAFPEPDINSFVKENEFHRDGDDNLPF